MAKFREGDLVKIYPHTVTEGGRVRYRLRKRTTGRIVKVLVSSYLVRFSVDGESRVEEIGESMLDPYR
jgi:ribosomal protein L21E